MGLKLVVLRGAEAERIDLAEDRKARRLIIRDPPIEECLDIGDIATAFRALALEHLPEQAVGADDVAPVGGGPCPEDVDRRRGRLDACDCGDRLGALGPRGLELVRMPEVIDAERAD